MKGSCTLFFVRHGQTEHNVKGLIQGHSDSALTAEGKKECHRLKNRFKKVRIEAIYSSDLLRAKETARIIALPHRLNVVFNAALRERNYGGIEGKHWTILDIIHKDLVKLTDQERHSFRAHPLAESNKDVIDRLLPFVKGIAKKHLGEKVILVSHGGLIRIFLNYIGFIKPEDKIFIKNGEVVKVTTDGKTFQVKESL